ncbi:hypothetical protein B9Z55_021330 [Caenorhabditis nigoni]|uniref:CUB-like domain-containing protein n=1 Tax=Caenorhabditis nigoni TaxID=1611254 RepID=A0A2G5TRN6_9PELO|nr:hypothetical protein B9Z55_021330 [Caenorhabditis nigoni]
MITLLLILFSSLHLISAIISDCKNGKIIFDPSSPDHSYQANFSSPEPVSPANFSCEFQINVPEGSFARVELTLISLINSQSSVVIFDQLNRSETVFAATPSYFYFIASGGRIQFSTDSNKTNFGFTVFWNKYPNPAVVGARVNASDTQPIIETPHGKMSILINAETKVSATILKPQLPYLLKYLRGVIFFDGPDWNNTKNFGTGLQLLNGNTQYVSTGNSMTVLILSTSLDDFAWLIFQDYERTKDIKRFQGVWCDRNISPCGSITLDATNGPVALQVSGDDSVISGLNGTGQLEVYIGIASQNKTNLVATYHPGAAETSSSLPQSVFGTFKTFLMTNGNATITFNDTQDAHEMTVPVGKTGFISSNNYGTFTYQLCDMLLHSAAKSKVKFRYSISQIDLVGQPYFEISGQSNGKLVYNRIVFHADPEYFYFIANGGRIQFSTDSNETNFGFRIFYDKYQNFTMSGGSVNVSNIVPLIKIPDFGGSMLIKAETKVSATVMRLPDDYMLHYLRCVIFFDGPSYNNTKNIGTGLQLLNGNTQYVSTGNSITVLILDNPPVGFAWLLFQDYELTKDIKSYQGAYCNSFNPCGSITLDATNGPAALQIYNKNDVNVISDLSGSGQLEVYIGAASQNKTNLVATYNAGETSSSLPQKVFGFFKTLLLTDGNATVTFNDTYTEGVMYVSVGSTGFLSSDRYGRYALQSCYATLLNSYKSIVKFRWSISDIDLVGDMWLQVFGEQIINNERSTYVKNYNASNPPTLNSYEEFIGTSMTVNFGDRECKNGKIVIDNTHLVYRYPANFSAPGPVFPANFKCEFQINVPEGWYAVVQVSLISPNNSQSSAVIFDQLDRSET